MAEQNKIVYSNRTFNTANIDSASLHLASGLMGNRLEAGTFTAVAPGPVLALAERARQAPSPGHPPGPGPAETAETAEAAEAAEGEPLRPL